MKIKYIIIILLIVFSCKKKNQTEQDNGTKSQIEEQDNKQFFSDYYFKIESPCTLEKDFSNSQENYYTYRCNSKNNETVYSFSIKDFKNEQNQFKTYAEKLMSADIFLDSYKKELNKNNIKYKEPYIYGFKALEYTIQSGDIFNKQAIFVSNGFAYTFNVTTNERKIDKLFSDFTNSFELYHKSPKYSYSIEIPKGYSQQEIIGKNVDLKYVDDKENSIVIAVKKLPNNENSSIDDMLSLSDDFWKETSPYPEMNIVKKGVIFVDNTKGMFMSMIIKEIQDEETLYHENNMFIKNGLFYSLTTTCSLNDIHDMRPVFFRVSHSLKFPN